MTGKTSEQIIAAVGNPSSISSLSRGQTLLQWQATGCHMSILFGADDKFIKVTHQYAQYDPRPIPMEPYPSRARAILTIIGIILGIYLLLFVMSGHHC
jgi:hypothetical protein